MYNVAILGYRHQGSVHHAPAFAKLPDCQIVAVCDIVAERARAGAERYGVPAYADADEMLDGEQIDIVDVPVGEQYRFDLVMKCLSRGKNVFTEKPLAGERGQFQIQPSDIPRARAIIDEWQRSGVALGLCFGLHGATNVRRAKDVIRSGQLGRLRMMVARTALGSWNHIIDLMRSLGGEVAEVIAFSDDEEQMPNKVACLRFENGAIGSLSVSSNLSLQFEIKWIGEAGEIAINNIAGTATWRLHNSNEVTRWSDSHLLEPDSYHRIFDRLIADFVASIRDSTTFDADGWAGLRHIEIDAAITGSILSGKPVVVERYLPEHGHTIFT